MHKPDIGSCGYYQDRFSREITDGIPIEPTKPIEPLWKSIVAGVFLILFMAVVIVVF